MKRTADKKFNLFRPSPSWAFQQYPLQIVRPSQSQPYQQPPPTPEIQSWSDQVFWAEGGGEAGGNERVILGIFAW